MGVWEPVVETVMTLCVLKCRLRNGNMLLYNCFCLATHSDQEQLRKSCLCFSMLDYSVSSLIKVTLIPIVCGRPDQICLFSPFIFLKTITISIKISPSLD